MFNEPIMGFMGLPGGLEWVVIAVIALLIFGRRLPQAAHALGSSFVEFKKGIKDAKEETQVEL